MSKVTDTYELILEAKGAGASAEEVRKLQKELSRLEAEERKAKKEMEQFLKEVGSASSPAEIATAALDKLKDTLKLGMVGGLAAAAIGQIMTKAEETEKAMDALNDSFESFITNSNGSNTAKPMEKLAAEAAEARKQITALEKEADKWENPDFFSMRTLEKAGSALLGQGGEGDEDSVMGRQKRMAENMHRQANEARDREEKAIEEISARKKQAERESDIAFNQASGSKSDYKDASAAGERARIARENLERAEGASNRDSGEVKKRQMLLAIAERAAREANAQAALSDHTLKIEDQMAAVRMSSASAVEKNYKLAKLTAEAVEAQLYAAKDLNVEQAEGLRIKSVEAKDAVRAMDEQLNKGKTQKEIRDRIHKQDKEKDDTEKFRKRREADRGLIGVTRDLDGKVISGRDPITGEKKNVKEDEFAKFFHGQKDKRAAESATAAALRKTIGTKETRAREEAKKKADAAAKDPVKKLGDIETAVKDVGKKIEDLTCKR